MYTKGKSMIFIVRTKKVLNYLRVALKAEKKNKMITLSKHCQFFINGHMLIYRNTRGIPKVWRHLV